MAAFGVVEAVPGQRLAQRVQRRADVADDADVDRVVGVDLGGEAVDVDDPLVPFGLIRTGSNSCSS